MLVGAPDIAVGDVLGSCVFNLAILALVDLLHRDGSVYSRAGSAHVLSAAFGVVLLCAVGLAVLLSRQGTMPVVGHVSASSLVLLVLYLVAMRTIYRLEQRETTVPVQGHPAMTFRHALTGYAVAASVIIAAGIWLPFVGVELARTMGWSNSFVGTLFIAFATSVPELATTLGALRIGAIDMALGNLLGSNLFDVLILVLDDLAYLPGSIYRNVAQVHAATAITAAMMSGAVIVALVYRPTARVLRSMSWASISLVVLYMINAAVQFRHVQ
ncbi:sodium:calcium antiporter [Variovorax paradoxus]|uniref:Putative calcium/sodium:proton antiporter n=1 Tax=Variovorax paradoxus TaxID=34073 RepID=A0A0H2LSI8_VARPD|nr:sodium:calcium antiporter [Variovorax paradoxus]KLN53273.1 putative calcium/sodium:proton antiporter [Variovorax paradoxus]